MAAVSVTHRSFSLSSSSSDSLSGGTSSQSSSTSSRSDIASDASLSPEPSPDTCRTFSRKQLLGEGQTASTAGAKQSLSRAKLQNIAMYNRAKVETPQNTQNECVPKACVPLCSRCGHETKMVKGATFVRDDDLKAYKGCEKGPLALWQCSYCKNYEGTRASMILVLKRIFGKRQGGDVDIKVGRRPTYTRHGKLTIRLKRQGVTYTCYVPVKPHLPDEMHMSL